MTILEWKWQQFVGDIERDPFGPSGFHASDRFAGWLEGYADFCEENGDPVSARDFRWLVYVAIERAKGIRLDAHQADRERLITSAGGTA